MKTQKQKPEPVVDFHSATDADRGIITVIYKCSNCGDLDTERLFAQFSAPPVIGCAKCRAGFAGNGGGMYPMDAEEVPVN